MPCKRQSRPGRPPPSVRCGPQPIPPQPIPSQPIPPLRGGLPIEDLCIGHLVPLLPSPTPAPHPRPTAWSNESGQGLILGVLFLGLVLVVMLTVPGLALGYAEHADVQSAADAAALACATGATTIDLVDVRGVVYQRIVSVNPRSGPQAAAAAWGRNLAFWPVETLAFAAMASGADCTVAVEVRSTIPILSILGPGRGGLHWRTTAEAKAYAVPP